MYWYKLQKKLIERFPPKNCIKVLEVSPYFYIKPLKFDNSTTYFLHSSFH